MLFRSSLRTGKPERPIPTRPRCFHKLTCPGSTHAALQTLTLELSLGQSTFFSGGPPRHSPPPPSKGPRPTRLPQIAKAYPGPPRRVGRPPIAFSNSTANRSCPHHRHNLSPGGKVCRREGKHRHSAAPSHNESRNNRIPQRKHTNTVIT